MATNEFLIIYAVALSTASAILWGMTGLYHLALLSVKLRQRGCRNATMKPNPLMNIASDHRVWALVLVLTFDIFEISVSAMVVKWLLQKDDAMLLYWVIYQSIIAAACSLNTYQQIRVGNAAQLEMLILFMQMVYLNIVYLGTRELANI